LARGEPAFLTDSGESYIHLKSASDLVSSNIDSNDGHNFLVSLTGVTNAQTLTVSLTNVEDTTGNLSANVSVPMNVLVGDTNADAVDVSQTKSQSGNAVTHANFREDVNADGFIDAVDVSLVKSKSGFALPNQAREITAAAKK